MIKFIKNTSNTSVEQLVQNNKITSEDIVFIPQQKAIYSDGVYYNSCDIPKDTTYTAWGQPFFENGVPVNVSGDLTDVGSITLKRPSNSGNDPKIEVIKDNGVKLGLNLGDPNITEGVLVSRLTFADDKGHDTAHINITNPSEEVGGDRGSLQFVTYGDRERYDLDGFLFKTNTYRFRLNNDGLKVESNYTNTKSSTDIYTDHVKTSYIRTSRIEGTTSSNACIYLTTIDDHDHAMFSNTTIHIGCEVEAKKLGEFGFQIGKSSANPGYHVAMDKYNTVINNNGGYYIRYATDSDIVKNVSENAADWNSYRFLIDKNTATLKTSSNTQLSVQENKQRINFVGGDFRFVFKEKNSDGTYKEDGTDQELLLSSLLNVKTHEAIDEPTIEDICDLGEVSPEVIEQLGTEVVAGVTYYNETANKTISTYTGFSPMVSEATICSKYPITFTNAKVAQYVSYLTTESGYYVYALKYLPISAKDHIITVNCGIYE